MFFFITNVFNFSVVVIFSDYFDFISMLRRYNLIGPLEYLGRDQERHDLSKRFLGFYFYFTKKLN